MVGWYPGGRGYRAPYGANNQPTNQPEAINQLTNKAILEVGMIERNRLEYLLHAHWSWKSRVKLKAGLSLGIDGILAQRRNWP